MCGNVQVNFSGAFSWNFFKFFAKYVFKYLQVCICEILKLNYIFKISLGINMGLLGPHFRKIGAPVWYVKNFQF